ncbi:SUMF1/EgtB/PvdO family nonheme iron enzyme [uncultured Rubinisphaera sp.]|uniref:formylglycine-generating enzyme family protein n=1 Tax=uncultured Rubinisphaera sp. TaxID=1678686 RepID=UPI0030DA2574
MRVFIQHSFFNSVRKVTPLILFGIISGLLVLPVGCGGGGDEGISSAPAPPAPPKPATAPAPPAPAVGREGAPAKNNKVTNKPAEVEVSEEDQPNLFTANTSGNFLQLDGSLSNQKYDQRNQLAFANPPGITGNHFTIASQSPNTASGRRGSFNLPPNFKELPEFGYDASGWPRRIQCNVDQSVMAYIPEGVFIQGKNGADPKVGPEHPAFVSAFYIDIHEVTNENFLKYREYLSGIGERSPQSALSEGSGPTMPVSGVLWRDAAAYLEYIGKQLPTESEWEKAARGAGGFDHPWGFGRAAWHKPRELMQISIPMSYPADKSPYGVFDMAGNVKEWCADWYAPNAYELALATDGSVPRNWEGPKSSEPKSTHVVKGNGENWTLWHREGASMTDRPPKVGFRGVLRLPRR